MTVLLPPELLSLVAQKCPCREAQIRQLASYYNGVFPSPPVLVAYGLETFSKIEVIKNVLERREIQYAVIKSRECLSQRHLLSKIFAACIAGFGQESQLEHFDKVDSINALLGNLRKLFEEAKGRSFVAVIADIDKLKQSSVTLLPAMARLGDLIPGLSIILTSSSPRPLILNKAGVPYVHFPPYSRSESIFIITSQPRPLMTEQNATFKFEESVISRLYAQFAVTVYDSLIIATSSSSIQTFQSTCEKLWPRFIEPMVSELESPGIGRKKSWDFAKLLVQNRGLFQSEGESALHHALPKRPQTSNRSEAERETLDTPGNLPSQSRSLASHPPLLKLFTTLVLLSAYLASHTLPKHDILLFSRLSTSSTTTSRKIRRLRRTPTKRRKTSTANGTPSNSNIESTTPTKSRTKSLFGATSNLGIPRPFTLERLVATLRAIHPHGIPNRPNRGVSDRVYGELGELERLRLVVRTSGSTASGIGRPAISGAGAGDDAGEEKWRVNVSRDWVVSMGHVWGMGISEYEVDQEW